MKHVSIRQMIAVFFLSSLVVLLAFFVQLRLFLILIIFLVITLFYRGLEFEILFKKIGNNEES